MMAVSFTFSTLYRLKNEVINKTKKEDKYKAIILQIKSLSNDFNETNKKLNDGKKVDRINRSASLSLIFFSFIKLDTKIALYGKPPSKEAKTQVMPYPEILKSFPRGLNKMER